MRLRRNPDPLASMTPLAIDATITDGDWGKYVKGHALAHGMIDRMGVLPRGTVNGLGAFEILVTLDDGSKVIAETTWALAHTAFVACAMRHGAP